MDRLTLEVLAPEFSLEINGEGLVLSIAEQVIDLAPAGIQGLKGDKGDPGSSLNYEAFAWGDASPKTIFSLTAGQTLFKSRIVILEAFNGVSPALLLGDAGQLDRFVSATQADAEAEGEYETNPGYTAVGSTDVLLSILPGLGCTQGSGFVIWEVS